ncbi:putative SOS response-associated peptidase YedK [Janthinobacterium sp. 61]|uniref:SOS response-associated peptidase n=1 Tax=Janthinobacterium sp. 61 TaxID=2035209 RepID=UPI000CC25736|nr:SOS response-associated peptidase [Janthinobacterium sp. 61]PKV44262.1 putative SOS response-associated peptidase YedK [Janthinobacterium sp. 61]
MAIGYDFAMCGRFDQNDTARVLASSFGWTDAVFDSEAEPHLNVSPGTYRPVMHVEDGVQRVDDVFWGYRPAWAAQAVPAPGKKKIPIAINARLEKLAGAYWKPLLRAGRGIVCVSGWYEWTGEKGSKQPWHIHRRDRAPLFLLALAHFGPWKFSREDAGFVLVTADSLGGMVDIHDRRPVAVSREDAHRWLEPALIPEQALHLARSCMLDTALFEWHAVDNPLVPAARAKAPPAAAAQGAFDWGTD